MPMSTTITRRLVAVLAVAALGTACAQQSAIAPSVSGPGTTRSSTATVAHVVIIMMENRSFDHYFGTYPGVNGIPANAACNPDPLNHTCVAPYHNTAVINYGGPHSATNTMRDIDGGKMDGFIYSSESTPLHPSPNPDDVMGYHTCADIPTYCYYAAHGVLADNAFAASKSWSTMAHLYMVSNWSATCTTPTNPMTCTTANSHINVNASPPPTFPWTDMTYLMFKNGVTWGYYVYENAAPLLTEDNDGEIANPMSSFNTLGLFNPMPGFLDIKADGQTANTQPGVNFDAQVKSGTLPQVAWVIPAGKYSDHPYESSIVNGQAFVQHTINEIETSAYGPTTLVVLMWDEWGGFYDHVKPPSIDAGGYGFRVPLILYGPMVKAGTIDHQLLSTDAVNKFIEDNFMAGVRLDPATDGRPDSRPDVRERTAGLGDIRNDLN